MMGGMIAGTFGITATFLANGALLLLTSLFISRHLHLKEIDTPAAAGSPASAGPHT
jgi:vacuolar-type H+-ATPase subunit I/STV1